MSAPCATIVLAALGWAAAHGTAPPPLSAEALRASCRVFTEDSEHAAAEACLRYVQGTVDAVGRRPVREPTPEESWTDRAARTRGARRAPLPAEAPPYCIDAAVPWPEIVRAVARQFELEPPAPATPAAEALKGALRRQYPCAE